MNEKVAKDLVKARQDVKRKLQLLKSNIAESEIQQEKVFKPITKPLQELVKNIKLDQSLKKEAQSIQHFSTPQNIKTSLSPKSRRKTNIYDKYLPTALPSFLTKEDTFQTINNNDDDDVFLNKSLQSLRHPGLSSTMAENMNESTYIEPTMEDLRESVLNLTKQPGYQSFLDGYHPLVRSFVDASLKGERDLDNTHGLFHDYTTEKWKIGDSQADFDKENGNFKIRGLTYEGTPGLYELLFFEDPHGYNSKDLDNYMDVLKRSNAYRRNYKPTEQIQGTSDPKYLTIIKPYLIEKKILRTQSLSARPFSKPQPPATRMRSTRITSKKGEGMMMDLTNKKIDYVYYDNPNELVERLKLLISSQMAGHTSHNNEIISIIEELKEAKVIL